MILRRTALVVMLATLTFGSASTATAQAESLDYVRLRDEGARLLSEYLRINTTNPPGNELATARWLKAILAREGIEGQILDTVELGPGRANFYARLQGKGDGEAIALVHHMDVVGTDPKNWSVDPFGGEIKDSAVWGRGALDMKGHGIIQLMALIALKRAGVPLAHDIVYIGSADEEIGGLGSRTFIERHPDLLRGVKYLLTESSDTRVENGRLRWVGVGVGEKRTWWKKMTAKGTTSHGSVPLGDNPVDRLVAALSRLAAWKTPVRLTPSVERFFKAQAADAQGGGKVWLSAPRKALASAKGRAWLLSDPDRNALLRNTITPTVLTGSNKTNIIPQEASAELDIRLLPDEDTVAFRRQIDRLIADPKITLESIGDMAPPYDAPLNTPLFKAIESVAARMHPGVPFATTTGAGATDRPYYAAAGIICYGLDPWLVELEEARHSVHGNNEKLSIENIGYGIRMYLEILREMNGLES